MVARQWPSLLLVRHEVEMGMLLLMLMRLMVKWIVVDCSSGGRSTTQVIGCQWWAVAAAKRTLRRVGKKATP